MTKQQVIDILHAQALVVKKTNNQYALDTLAAVERAVVDADDPLVASLVEKMEGRREKHWVFEFSGPRPNKTTKFENFCDDLECMSKDNIRVKSHNAAIDKCITIVEEAMK